MFSVKVINILRRIRLTIRRWSSTKYMYLFCALYGIKIGKKCLFWKRAVFYTEVGSIISFGNNCVVRSDLDSNLIGGNRRCIFSTHDPAARITIGNNCSFTGVTIGAKSSIVLGNNVLVGANSTITDFDWHSMDPTDRDNRDKIASKSVFIEDNVWIGANVIVLKGVRIGENTVIGSGSIVTRDMPSNAVCAGNPCRVIRMLE
jgi:acetyltransferase-like isoleucine patch superfamily enzyme